MACSLRWSTYASATKRNGCWVHETGAQHLRRAQHRPALSQEHHLDASTANQRFRQAEQAAGRGENLQAAGHTVATLEAKHRRSVFGGSNARSSASERWRRSNHQSIGQYRPSPSLHWRLRKAERIRGYPASSAPRLPASGLSLAASEGGAAFRPPSIAGRSGNGLYTSGTLAR